MKAVHQLSITVILVDLPVHRRACGLLVTLKGIGREENESGAGVYDASGIVHDGFGAILNLLVDTPVLRRRAGLGDGDICDRTGESSHVQYRTKRLN